MRKHRYLTFLALFFVFSASAQTSADICHLLKRKQSVQSTTVTFILVGAFPHGFIATSPDCLRTSVPINPLSLGDGSRARSFYRQVLFSPVKHSGIWEIQADVDLSPDRLIIKRIHAYRELQEDPFKSHFSPADEAIIQKAASESAKDAADAAAHR